MGAVEAREMLERSVPLGEVIRPWLLLGPFYEDVSALVPGLSLHERASGAGKEVLEAAIRDLASLLQSAPLEEQSSFREHAGSWRLVRRLEPFLSFGRYYIANHLVVALFSTVLIAEQSGTVSFSVGCEVPSEVVVAVNGAQVWTASLPTGGRTGRLYERTFAAELRAGQNRLTLALLRIGRMARVGFRLCADTPLTVQVPSTCERATRLAIEEEALALALERDLVLPGHEVAIAVPRRDPSLACLHLKLALSRRAGSGQGRGVKAWASSPSTSHENCRWPLPR